MASEKARATVSGNAAKAILLKSTGRTVPYGWQFPGEDICFLSEKSYKFNYFGLINRQSQCYWQVTEENINTEFILNFLEQLSFKISRTTFIVLDNARIHKNEKIAAREYLIGRKGDCSSSFCHHIRHI